MDLADARDERLGRQLLEDDGVCPDSHGVDHVGLIGRGREDEHARREALALDAAEDLEGPVAIQVQHQHVRLMPPDGIQGAVDVGTHLEHGAVGLPLEHLRQAAEGERMLAGQDQTDGPRRRFAHRAGRSHIRRARVE